MNLLITGANGFVGKQLCAKLSESNHTLFKGVRGTLVNGNQFNIDLNEVNKNLYKLLSDINVIIHLAARVHVLQDISIDPWAEFHKINVEGTINLARQAAQAGVKRFIFISSVKVNGEQTLKDKPFKELDKPNPQDPYGLSKFEAELGLLEIAKQTGMEVVIIRPPLVYGPGVKANFASLAYAVKHHFPLPLGAVHNKRSFIYVGNLVDFIIKCIDHPAAANQTFLVSDEHDLSTSELLRACGKALNKKVWLIPVPQLFIGKLASLIGKKSIAQRLCGNLQVDISKARQLVDWAPPISVTDGLKATFENK